MLIIRDGIERAAKRLSSVGIEGARREAWLLLAHVRGMDRATLLAHALDHLGPDEQRSFERLVDRRAEREPFAQIVGRREFWSLDFRITADVLCPRPDSEALIEAALAEAAKRRRARTWAGRVLDLGTGSGCLLLSLLSEWPLATGVGVDVDGRALSVARSNGERLGFDQRATWLCAHWSTALQSRFDVIVSNPPYIALSEAGMLPPEVREFEPKAALFAGEDGLDAYRALAADLGRILAPNGFACIEVGADQAHAVEALFGQQGLTTIGRERDLAGIVRCLIIEHH